MKTAKFPIVITKEGVSAKIYKATQVQGGKRYQGFMVVYSLLGKRKRVWRSDLEQAEAAASDACIKIANGEHMALELRNGDRLVYLRANEALAGLDIPLDLAAREYVSAVKDLPPGTTLKDAVDFFRSRKAVVLEKRTVQQIVDEMMTVKRTANLSDVYLDDLENRLNSFAADFQTNIGDVNGKLIQAWLDAMKCGGRSKYNYLRCISTLFRFAIRRKYLPKDALDEVESVERSKHDTDGPIEIFTPDEMRALLKTADESLVPFLAIGGFAGLRSSEILRLNWQDVKCDSDCIIVQKGKVRKRGRSRRIAPMLPNLKAWLKPFSKRQGKVWPHSKPYLYEALEAVAETAKVPLKANALRHSFISNRCASIKNVPQVAFESGNSPQIIDSNYRELVTDGEAEKWFAITPPRRAVGRRLNRTP